MSLFTDHFLLVLAGALLISILFFRSARKGDMVVCEAWRNLFYLLMSLCGLFLFLVEGGTAAGDPAYYFHILSLIILMVPAPYLILKMLFGPLYFASSARTPEEKFDLLYVRLGALERQIHLYMSMLAVLMAVLTLVDTVLDFDLRLLTAGLTLLVSGVGLFLIRNFLYAETLTNVAYLHMGRGELDTADGFLQRSLVVKRDMPKTWAALTEVNRRKGDLVRARRYLRMLERVSPSSPMVGLLEARLAYSRGKFTDCVRISRRMWEKYPSLAELQLLGGKASNAMGEWRQAVEFLEGYEKTSGPDAVSLAHKVKGCYGAKQYEKAVESYNLLEKAVEAFDASGVDELADDDMEELMKTARKYCGLARKNVRK